VQGLSTALAATDLPQTLSPFGANAMTIGVIALQPLVALIAGILILVIPRLLNIIVAIYLIFIGVTGLWPNLLH
jgi:Protein of unknown function (DUF3096)